MNVLSLFDGMSCGQQALERAGFVVDTYYASEIDKHAIKVTMANYPNTIQLGSVTEVDVSKLKKISFLCGGSPCQSFSFAGKRKGMSTKDNIEILTLDHYLELKEQKFQFEGQSYLFWEYMRILTDIRKYNPDVKFLLENVMMGEKWEKILTKAIGVNPIEINSALVSAQNRRRLYWTNIGLEPAGLFGDLESIIVQPKDKELYLKDVLEPEVDEKYFLSDKMINYLNTRKGNFNNGKINYKTGEDVASCINASSGQIDIRDNIIIDTNRKSKCFTAGGNSGGLHSQMDLVRTVIQLNPSTESNGKQPYQQNRVYSENGISPRLDTDSGNRNVFTNSHIRRLTPIECERLQTVRDNYTNHVSDTQRYKMLGNGWTVDVIVHILKYLKQ